MIINSVLDKFFSVLSLMLLQLFDDLNFDTLASNFGTLCTYILDIISYIYYFLPVTYLYPLIGLIGIIIVTRIEIALVRLGLEILTAIKFW